MCKHTLCSTPNAICCERGCPRTHAKITICQSRRYVRTVTANLQDWSCSLPYCARAVAARAEAVVGLDIASFVYHGLHLLLAGPTVILFIIASRACVHAQLTNAAGRCSCSRQVLLCTCTCLPLCNVPLQIDYGQLWSKQKASSRCLKHDRRPVDQAVQPELGLHMSPGCVLQLRCPHLGPTERRTTR